MSSKSKRICTEESKISTDNSKEVNCEDVLLLRNLRKELVSAKKKRVILSKNLARKTKRIQGLELLLHLEQEDNTRLIKLKDNLLEQVQKLKLTKMMSFHEENSDICDGEDNSTKNGFSTNQQLNIIESTRTNSSKSSNSSSIEEKPIWTIVEHPLLEQKFLLDKLGHKHRLLCSTREADWYCINTNRNKCRGYVVHNGNDFEHIRSHTSECQPKLDEEVSLRLTILMRKMIVTDKFRNLLDIAEEITTEVMKVGLLNELKLEALEILIFQYYKKQLPHNPYDLWVDIDMNFIPDNFLRGEVTVFYKKHPKRHLIFATEQQKHLLGIAKRWYLDLTYKMVQDPFLQILHISAIQHEPYDMRPISLAFVLMSRMTTKDFTCVFNKLLEILEQKVYVEQIVCDYQTSLWQAAKTCFPYATVTGCGYHWFRDVCRAMKKCELDDLFKNNEEVKKVCLRLLHLYLLPSKKIPKIFSLLRKKASKLDLGDQSSQLAELFFDIETTWINNPMWPIDTWSMFGEPFRNCCMVESWQSPILRGHCQTIYRYNFYELVFAFFTRIAEKIKDDGIKELLCRDSMLEVIRTQSSFQQRIVELWENYECKEMGALKLLKLCTLQFLKPIRQYNRHVSTVKFSWCPDDEKDIETVYDE